MPFEPPRRTRPFVAFGTFVVVSVAVSAVSLAVGGCRTPEMAPRGPEVACVNECAAHAKSCDENTCRHGCRFVLDRLVEREGESVIACVSRARACDDAVWAECAARIGHDSKAQ